MTSLLQDKNTAVEIEQLVEDMPFDTLILWADLLGVEHNEKQWFDDEWPDKENELRVAVVKAHSLAREQLNQCDGHWWIHD